MDPSLKPLWRVWAWVTRAARESSFAVAFGCLLMALAWVVMARMEAPPLAATPFVFGCFALGSKIGNGFDYRQRMRRRDAEQARRKAETRRKDRKRRPTKALTMKVPPAKALAPTALVPVEPHSEMSDDQAPHLERVRQPNGE